MSTAKVAKPNTINPTNNGIIPFIRSPSDIVDAKVLSKNTLASCECASESAHNLRYDAVFEIVPSTNSIVSIIWWMKNSVNE